MVNYSDRTRTKYTGLCYQSSHHNSMCKKEVIHRVGIKLVQAFVDFIGILDLGNILVRCQHLFAVQYRGDLLQT